MAKLYYFKPSDRKLPRKPEWLPKSTIYRRLLIMGWLLNAVLIAHFMLKGGT